MFKFHKFAKLDQINEQNSVYEDSHYKLANIRMIEKNEEEVERLDRSPSNSRKHQIKNNNVLSVPSNIGSQKKSENAEFKAK